jgi:hypothetical protein
MQHQGRPLTVRKTAGNQVTHLWVCIHVLRPSVQLEQGKVLPQQLKDALVAHSTAAESQALAVHGGK